ncbi:MAG: ZIP family metal transporter [Candidatus Bathyarchaeia archaeon]
MGRAGSPVMVLLLMGLTPLEHLDSYPHNTPPLGYLIDPYTWLYSLLGVLAVSLISLIGIFTVSLSQRHLSEVLLYLVALSVGGLFGGALIHLVPEVIEQAGFRLEMSLYILVGIVTFFVVEKLIRWRHCHIPTSEAHPHPLGVMNLVGDGVHNFIDGLIIGSSYMAGVHVGGATTLAVILHEIPQEIGDFGVLVHAGLSKSKALALNFLTAITAMFGAVTALLLTTYIEGLIVVMTLFAAGGFIYVAGSDLVPELHKEVHPKKSILQLLTLILGVLIMLALKYS